MSKNDADTPPWLQAVPEEDPEGGTGFGGNAVMIIALGSLALVILFVAAIYVLYDEDAGPPPHIAAPVEPVRVVPEDRGGMAVADQDKEIYERGAGAEPNPDAVLAEVEEQPVSDIPDQASVPTEPDPVPEPEPSLAATVEPALATESEPEAAPDPGVTQPAPAPAPVPETSDEIYRVQLGAFGNTIGAERAWSRLKQKYRSDLGALQPTYEAVETSDRTLYRLRVGPLYEEADADALCIALKARGQACMVVRP